MATLHDFFVAEVAEHLRRLEEALDRGESSNMDQVHRAARALRGTAQIAREDAAFRGANVLESATRALLDGRIPLDAATVDRLRASAEDLRAIARGADDEARAASIAARWAELGIDARVRNQPGTVAQETRAFLEFAAREVEGIVDELDRSVVALTAEPMDRESLKAVLRRQRALLGSARLEEIPVLAETLRAVEDLSSVIAKLDVAVRNEWLDVFRCARDVLTSAADLLQTGRQPEPTTGLSRLRVLRQELLERHGSGEAVSTAPGADGLLQPEVRTPDDVASAGMVMPPAPQAPAAEVPEVEVPAPERAQTGTPAPAFSAPQGGAAGAPAPQPDAAGAPAPPSGATSAAPLAPAVGADRPEPAASVRDEGIDVRELQYRGERAIARAAELRPVLERMLADQRGGREALAELYDLIRLARE